MIPYATVSLSLELLCLSYCRQIVVVFQTNLVGVSYLCCSRFVATKCQESAGFQPCLASSPPAEGPQQIAVLFLSSFAAMVNAIISDYASKALTKFQKKHSR